MQRTSSWFSDTLTVKPTSWHGRRYDWWQGRARFKNTPAYRENLCHYMRVVLIWTTVMKLKDAAGSIGSFIAGHGGSWFARGLGGACRGFGRHYRRHPRLYSRLAMAVLLVGALYLLIMGIIYILQNLVTVATSIVGMVLAAVLMGGMMRLADRLYARRKQRAETGVKTTPIRDTIQLAGTAIMAKKRGICPFIVFDDQDGQQQREVVDMIVPPEWLDGTATPSTSETQSV